MYKNAIVRKPAASMVQGITSAKLGKPDYDKACQQHEAYIKALITCGLKVYVMEAEEEYPDGMFVEDTAVVTQKCAMITRPGAPSRLGEEESVSKVIALYIKNVGRIEAPGCLEGGDVMQVGDHFYVGISERTNMEGFEQFQSFFQDFGYTATPIEMSEFLHLKTGLAYIENNNLLIAGEFLDNPEFDKFNQVPVIPEESYAANCIWLNNTVLVPAGFPRTLRSIQQCGNGSLTLEMSEFRKLDGGLSCLSLRF